MSYVPTEGVKQCRRCLKDKPVTEFRVFDKGRVTGDRQYRRSWCRDCDREYVREWRRRNPGYHAERARRYRALERAQARRP